jgi:hypothetical protein
MSGKKYIIADSLSRQLYIILEIKEEDSKEEDIKDFIDT